MRSFETFINVVNTVKMNLNDNFVYFTVSNHDIGAYAGFKYPDVNILVFSSGNTFLSEKVQKKHVSHIILE